MLFKGSQFLFCLGSWQVSELWTSRILTKIEFIFEIMKKIMQVRGDIIEVDAQNFYEQDFSCKLILIRSLRRISKT